MAHLTETWQRPSPRKLKHRVRKALLEAMTDSPLEHLLRTAYVHLSPAKADAYDRQTAKVMGRVLREDSNCIDVGAYRGEILREMLRLCPRGTHHAFEPTPKNFQFLRRKFPRARIHNMALGERPDYTTFQYVTDRPALSGLRRVDYPDDQQEVEEIRVRVEPLALVLGPELHVDFIKIDVEGAELPVLKGAADIISRDRPVIVFEHGWRKARQYESTPQQVFEVLNHLGMRISLMEQWLQRKEPLSRAEFCAKVYHVHDFVFMAHPPETVACHA